MANSPGVVAGLPGSFGPLQADLLRTLTNRQGLIEWGNPAFPSWVDGLQHQLEHTGPVRLGGVVIEGMQMVGQTADRTDWSLLVSAPSLDGAGEIESFVVPLTQCAAALSPVGRAEPSLEFIRHSAAVVDHHLSRVEWGYHDSPHMPLMLNHGVQGAAECAVAFTELRSRALSGLVDGAQSAARQRREVMATMGVSSRLTGPEVVAIDDWLTACPDEPLPPTDDQHAQHLLAQRRHQPAVWIQPANLTAVQPQIINPSTLAAYRQPQLPNHCGLAAVNAFFQANVVTPAQAVQILLKQREAVFGQPGAPMATLGLPGLHHPKIIRALQDGQAVRMTRTEFCGQTPQRIPPAHEALYMATPAGEWDALCRLSPGQPGVGDEIWITPDIWLSATTGMHLDQVEGMVNELLAERPHAPAWQHMPERVERLSAIQASGWAHLEQQINATVLSAEGQGRPSNFPMVCMVPGHYFAVARTSDGAWVKLDSLGTAKAGIQAPELFATAGELGRKLREAGVIHVVCEPLLTC
ncbi:hypothetical protein NQT62_04895 [Limnobacter humi]|uniref:Peptidase C39-like domain-containing protein n=1 Tax=Limnobacter humi TaxID=1778671 RepID=A0ABT1WH61_9BURK|nr:hypothetical protein [Limnobacter humi]MCQ8895779.1 hypothetical protein [Limnobacter humi]